MFFSIGLRKGLVGGRLGWARRGREHSEDWEHWEDSVSAARWRRAAGACRQAVGREGGV